MNNWNSTTNGNPTISGMYIVTIETNDEFRTRYIRDGEYLISKNSSIGEWYLPDSFFGTVSEKESQCKVVAWQATPEVYMGE